MICIICDGEFHKDLTMLRAVYLMSMETMSPCRNKEESEAANCPVVCLQ